MSEKGERKAKKSQGGKGKKKEIGTSVTEGAAADTLQPPRLKTMKIAKKPEGAKVVLKCEAISENSALRFKWQKDGKEFTKKNSPSNITIKIKKKKKSSELHISTASHADAGEYTCTVWDKLGNDTKKVNVDILPVTTTPTIGTGHLLKCIENKKSYCVNGGECFVLRDITSSSKYVCKCPNMFIGDRCQNYVMTKKSFYKAEELNQKKVWTVTGICIALLVVGIMCVLAYCKAKKQRKKFHDRLRQSLRTQKNKRVNMTNGPRYSNPLPENVQLVNQYVTNNIISHKHVVERETETSFSGNQYRTTTHHSTTVVQTSSHSWCKDQPKSIISESPSVPMALSVTNGQHASPISHRGRLNGVGGPRDGSSVLRHARNTPYSSKDSPHSEMYISDMATPARMLPADFQTSCSPNSLLSDMSPPVSRLTVPIPSVAFSPFMEEEKPLLMTAPSRPQENGYNYYYSQKFRPYRYDPMNDGRCLAPSMLRIVEDKEYEITQEYESAQEVSTKLGNIRQAKRTQPNSHISNRWKFDTDTNSESSSAGCETEEDRIGVNTPFLDIQIPLTTSLDSAAACQLSDCRTNQSGRLYLQGDLQVRLSCLMANQDPIAI